jgi:hypothetical protein
MTDCQFGRAGGLALCKGEGRMRDDFNLVDALNGAPLNPLPSSQRGEATEDVAVN